jgi:hypothetical protein
MYTLTRLTLLILHLITYFITKRYEKIALKAIDEKRPYADIYHADPTNLVAATNAMKYQVKEDYYSQKYDTWDNRLTKVKSARKYRNTHLGYVFGSIDTALSIFLYNHLS